MVDRSVRSITAAAWFAVVGSVSSPAADDATLATRLAAVANQSNAQITTVGRKTGKPHTVTVWFVADGDAIYLTTLDEHRDWVQNAEKSPAVTLSIDDLHIAGQFSRVTDPGLDTRIRTLRGQKYTLGRIAAWFGYDTASTFRVGDLHLAPAPQMR